MRSSKWIKLSFLLVASAAVSCSEGNPSYVDAGWGTKEAGQEMGGDLAPADISLGEGAGSDLDVGVSDLPLDNGPGVDAKLDGDLTQPLDVKAWPDLQPPPDQMQPDSVAWQCKTSKDCNDSLSCTKDVCTAAKKCTNTLSGGWCNISGSCYKKNAKNGTNDCQICDPSSSTTAWTSKANGAKCKDDGIFCTFDYCGKGACTHPTQTNWCLISGACSINGKWNPSNECQQCNVTKSQKAWSNRPDKTSCKGDSLWCTTDQCKTGACTHTLSSGCLINKACLPEGNIKVGDPCKECVGKKTRTAYTFVTGKPCYTSSNLAGMCLSSSCKGWKESYYRPKGGQTTELAAVEYVPKAGKMWAAGSSSISSSTKGLLVQVDSTATTLPSVKTSASLTDLSYNLAVGTKGQHYRYSGTTWAKLTVTGGGPASADRLAVWGTVSGSTEAYMVGGKHTATTSGIYSCVYSASGLACKAQKGFGTNETIGSLRGTKLTIGVIGIVWGAVINPTGKEHIYYNVLSSSSWSAAAPLGCIDGGAKGTTPCSNSSSTVTKMGGADPKDIWLVGTKGLIMRFDGSKWKSLTSVLKNQTSYSFDAVYASPKDKLTTFAAHTDSTSGRTLALFNYNGDLDRWLGPMIIHPPGSKNFKDIVRDIDGTGYTNLWMVGRRVPINTTPATVVPSGWILQLK